MPTAVKSPAVKVWAVWSPARETSAVIGYITMIRGISSTNVKYASSPTSHAAPKSSTATASPTAATTTTAAARRPCQAFRDQQR
ncbi:MAG: hypothetical protein ABSA16_15690 [Thermoguttaceae bacterium]